MSEENVGLITEDTEKKNIWDNTIPVEKKFIFSRRCDIS